jgi:xanthine dehydrogenase accessory factor
MKEIRDILQSFARARQEGKQAALATVVHVEGSSYRGPGARMLITDDGQLTGAISGGCLEGDALHKALLAMQQQQNKLVTYDTTDEDDLQFGIQLGCNGIVHILFEPIRIEEPNNPIQLLETVSRDRRNSVLVTLFSFDGGRPQLGTSLLYADDQIQSVLPEPFYRQLLPDVYKAFREGASSFHDYGSQLQVVQGFEGTQGFEGVQGFEGLHGFVEFLSPSPALVIAGGGNDVQPLVEIVSLLGWHTTLVDGRAQYATAQRFKKAERVVVCKPQQVLSELRPDAQTHFVLMTHNYNYDLALLRELIATKIHYPYIGVLGPRKKLDRMLDELHREGLQPHEKQLASLHGPIGLNIGAETAAEIAVSIVSEIQALRMGRTGAPLKDSRASIHGRGSMLSSHE